MKSVQSLRKFYCSKRYSPIIKRKKREINDRINYKQQEENQLKNDRKNSLNDVWTLWYEYDSSTWEVEWVGSQFEDANLLSDSPKKIIYFLQIVSQ